MEKQDLIIYADIIEESAKRQIDLIMTQDSFKNQKIRIMPDCHTGAGCVIGFTSTMSKKVIPNIIGVDIGCGMRIAELGKIDIDYKKLDEFIKGNIPSGLAVNDKADERAEQTIDGLICKDKLKNMSRLVRSLGSLGGGNHFIEVDVDDYGNKYLVVHTGSRNLGLQVATYYQNFAIKNIKKNNKKLKSAINDAIATLKAENRVNEIEETITKIKSDFQYTVDIPDELCYLEGADMKNYMHDMRICQHFAKINRENIVAKILKFLCVENCDIWESVHNYIDDKNIIRKGAISAHRGEKVIIPMNMRDGCIIGVGKGKSSWNCSAPHGAGRLMSRTEAFEKLNIGDFREQMQGVYTTTATAQTIDEAPMAYKPMADILKFVEETVKVKCIIKPVYNFKAVEEIISKRKENKTIKKGFSQMRNLSW